MHGGGSVQSIFSSPPRRSDSRRAREIVRRAAELKTLCKLSGAPRAWDIDPNCRGPRIAADSVPEYLASGITHAGVPAKLPYVVEADILACLAFAEDRERRIGICRNFLSERDPYPANFATINHSRYIYAKGSATERSSILSHDNETVPPPHCSRLYILTDGSPMRAIIPMADFRAGAIPIDRSTPMLPTPAR